MSKNPIDRGDQPLSAYLNKILTILIKQSVNNELRIPASLMVDDVGGEGFSKHYDRDTRELVLRYLPAASEVYYNKSEDSPCQTLTAPSNQQSNRQRSSQVQPLRPSDLMEDSTSSQQPVSRNGSTLNDQQIMDLEDHYRKEAAARIVANFPGTPVTKPSSRPLSNRLPSQPVTQGQQKFYKD